MKRTNRLFCLLMVLCLLLSLVPVKTLADGTMPAPQNLNYIGFATSIAWSAVEGANVYGVEIYKEDGSCVHKGHYTRNSVNIADILVYSGRYYFTVYASNDATSAGSTAARSTVFTYEDTVAPKLDVISVVRDTNYEGKVTFISGEAGQYYYAIGEVPDTSGTGTACVKGNNTIELKGLAYGTQTLNIRVKDVNGNVSETLSAHIHIVGDNLATPKNLNYVGAFTTVSWGAVDGANRYQVIIYREDGTVAYNAGFIPENYINIAQQKLETGNYYVAVSAVNLDTNRYSTQAVSTVFTYTDTVVPKVSPISAKRISETEAQVTFSTNEDGSYYWAVGKDPDTSSLGDSCFEGENTVILRGLAAGAQDIRLQVKDRSGNLSSMLTFSIPEFVPPTYIIQYHAGRGTGAPANQVKTYKVDLKLSTQVPTRTDYIFLGWATDADATEPEYQPGDSFTANADTLLHAVWKEDRYTIPGVSMRLGNSLGLYFWIPWEKTASGDYAVITREYANGETVSVTVPWGQWIIDMNYVGEYLLVKFDGLAAKEMTDTVTCTIYNAAGEQTSKKKVTSIQTYAHLQLEAASASAALKTVLVDMLNYGAQAQKQFDYAQDRLATSRLTDAQKALATASIDMDGLGHQVTKGTGWAGGTLSLQDNIVVHMILDAKVVTSDMSAKVSYTGYDGSAASYIISGSEFEPYGDGSAYIMVNIESLVVSDLATVVHVDIYDGETLVSENEYNMAQYCQTMQAYPIAVALAKYCQSAHDYFA